MAQATGFTAGKKGKRLSSYSAAAQKKIKAPTLRRPRNSGKITKPAPASEPYEIGLDKRLRESPKHALDYLNLCLDDPDPHLFLLALRDVARAYGGMTKLSQKSGLNREALYSSLSKIGNPTIINLEKLLDVLGFRLKLELK